MVLTKTGGSNEDSLYLNSDGRLVALIIGNAEVKEMYLNIENAVPSKGLLLVNPTAFSRLKTNILQHNYAIIKEESIDE